MDGKTVTRDSPILQSEMEPIVKAEPEQKDGDAEAGRKLEDLKKRNRKLNKSPYLAEIDKAFEQMKKDKISKKISYKQLCARYKGKYSKKVLAGAYTKYTNKKDKLNKIDYSKILKESGHPVKKGEHAHHIVYKKGRKGKMREYAYKAQEILRRYDIDPITNPHNLVSAPNKGHSIDNIKEVYEGLAKAEKEALKLCDKCKLSKKDKKEYVKNILYEELNRLGKIAANR